MSISIQPLSDSDLVVADAILKAAFLRSDNWIPDLQMCRRLQPDGYFLAYQNGMPVGMVGAVIYSNYAYIGLMAVHPSNQCQGVGFALMQYLLAWLKQKNMTRVFLDASEAGQPLYEKLGFVACDQVFVFQCQEQGEYRHPPHLQPLLLRDLDLLNAHDVEAFGADRSRLLRTLFDTFPKRAFLLRDTHGQISGYLFAQRSRIGPWVMLGQGAEALLRSALSLSFDRPPSVAVPEENTEAITLLQHHGFKLVRVNRHMARGLAAPFGQRRNIFGQTSLFFG